MNPALLILLAIRERVRRERGAVALATLAFMMVAGLATLVTLWSLGLATGAYNQLYSATQGAAFAAATQTSVDATGDGEQLQFDCGGGTSTECTSGQTLAIAQQVFNETFPTPGTGFLSLGGAAYLVDERSARRNVVYTYEVGLAPGKARAEHQAVNGGAGCDGNPAGQPLVYNATGQLVCWSISEQRSDSPIGGYPQYSSGVVVYSQAQLLVPGLGRVLGERGLITLSVGVAARQAQTAGPTNY